VVSFLFSGGFKMNFNINSWLLRPYRAVRFSFIYNLILAVVFGATMYLIANAANEGVGLMNTGISVVLIFLISHFLKCVALDLRLLMPREECFVEIADDFIVLRKHKRLNGGTINIAVSCLKRDSIIRIIETTDGEKKGLSFVTIGEAVAMEFEAGIPFAFKLTDLKNMMGDVWCEA